MFCEGIDNPYYFETEGLRAEDCSEPTYVPIPFNKGGYWALCLFAFFIEAKFPFLDICVYYPTIYTYTVEPISAEKPLIDILAQLPLLNIS